MTYMETLGKRAKDASPALAMASQKAIDAALLNIKNYILENFEEIIFENKKDTDAAKALGMTEAKLDRLALDKDRIEKIAAAIDILIKAKSPVGEVVEGCVRPNGLRILKTRVPLGVIGMIFESRPNVCADAATLCLKSGNCVILRGGKESLNTCKALTKIMRQALADAALPKDCIQIVEDTSRDVENEMMCLNDYIDVLIPRGGKNLINAVAKQATVPVIKTGLGNCHLYIDKAAEIDMALKIADNAKTQRPSVCNAIETLLCHEDIADEFLPKIAKIYAKHNVKIYGCEKTRQILGNKILEADETAYATEFNDYIIAIKVVKDIDEAIEHIRKYTTNHSEAIVTDDLKAAEKFQKEVDAACVYVNASTRFTDGGEFGLGAEIGISTQKLHTRGPMGLSELTTFKYLINGNGQIRE